jgi:acyl-CoA synthetase (AMP-forming)/AMP-acid ligase II
MYGDRLAVVDGDRRRTYEEVAEEASRVAAYLRMQGARPGDRCAILGENSLEYLVSYFAAAACDVVLVPLNVRLSPAELAFICKDSEPRVLIADPVFRRKVAALAEMGALPPALLWTDAAGGVQDAGGVQERIEGELRHDSEGRITPAGHSDAWRSLMAGACPPESNAPVDDWAGGGDDLAHLYYTSGTTGRPKGVMLTHRNVCAHALGTIAELSLSAGDVWGHIAPMFHLADAWATFAITWVGGCHVMVRRFDAELVLSAIETHGITVTNLIPTMLNLMVKHPSRTSHDYSSLRMLLSGGAPIAPALVEGVIDTFGCEYVQTYGMTETSPYLTLSLLEPHLKRLPPAEQLAFRARTGRPFITVSLRVVDRRGREVAPDDESVGEIQARGETVTAGYWRRPEETAAAFTDGWLRTGDLAVVDEEGYINIVDRLKDVIITGGENVYSTEVENVIYEHPAVLEAAVFGRPDETWGESVCAGVVLKKEHRGRGGPGRGEGEGEGEGEGQGRGRGQGEEARYWEEEIIAHCRETLARYKTPRRVILLDSLPKTGSGKIRKASLREAFEGCSNAAGLQAVRKEE